MPSDFRFKLMIYELLREGSWERYCGINHLRDGHADWRNYFEEDEIETVEKMLAIHERKSLINKRERLTLEMGSLKDFVKHTQEKADLAEELSSMCDLALSIPAATRKDSAKRAASAPRKPELRDRIEELWEKAERRGIPQREKTTWIHARVTQEIEFDEVSLEAVDYHIRKMGLRKKSKP